MARVLSPTRAEPFTDDEQAKLAPYFTNSDKHVFALTNLPETVKGALFARYSRSAKSLRRLFLDEFASEMPATAASVGTVGTARAEKLYDRVFNEYGDDSVAQLGGAHVACEYVSNVLTKVLEWGRLMAYLEQSTRYVPYTDKLHGRWRYHVPDEVTGALRDRYTAVMDEAFMLYARWIPAMQEHFERRHPWQEVQGEKQQDRRHHLDRDLGQGEIGRGELNEGERNAEAHDAGQDECEEAVGVGQHDDGAGQGDRGPGNHRCQVDGQERPRAGRVIA